MDAFLEKHEKKVRVEYVDKPIIGHATMEGRRDGLGLRNVYLFPNGDYHFISQEFDGFLILPPDRVLTPEGEVWYKLLHGRGWYAVKVGEKMYDCRFQVH